MVWNGRKALYGLQVNERTHDLYWTQSVYLYVFVVPIDNRAKPISQF